MFDFICGLLGLDNAYRIVMNQAVLEIKKLADDVSRLDRKNSLDVRTQLDVVNFDNLGEIVWVKVSDDRMLRYDVFNQIRDYLRAHKKDNSVLLLTGTNVQLISLTDEDLQRSGLKRMAPRERH